MEFGEASIPFVDSTVGGDAVRRTLSLDVVEDTDVSFPFSTGIDEVSGATVVNSNSEFSNGE